MDNNSTSSNTTKSDFSKNIDNDFFDIGGEKDDKVNSTSSNIDGEKDDKVNSTSSNTTKSDFSKNIDNNFFDIGGEKDDKVKIMSSGSTDILKPKEPVISNNEDEDDIIITNSSPELMKENNENYPDAYLRIISRIKYQYSQLPSLNYDAIYKELSILTLHTSPTPTLEVLMDEVYKVQASKDRLSQIVTDVIICYNFKKRAIDIVKDAWGKFTSEKNAESRKGDAAYRLSGFLTDFARTESLFRACDHVLKNLDSLQDNLSRRITTYSLIIKMREGRMGLPDHDFDKETPSDKLDDIFKSDEKEELDENGEVKLRGF